jgi:hypothetical protein
LHGVSERWRLGIERLGGSLLCSFLLNDVSPIFTGLYWGWAIVAPKFAVRRVSMARGFWCGQRARPDKAGTSRARH